MCRGFTWLGGDLLHPLPVSLRPFSPSPYLPGLPSSCFLPPPSFPALVFIFNEIQILLNFFPFNICFLLTLGRAFLQRDLLFTKFDVTSLFRSFGADISVDAYIPYSF